jgi:hypothetical protein
MEGQEVSGECEDEKGDRANGRMGGSNLWEGQEGGRKDRKFGRKARRGRTERK